MCIIKWLVTLLLEVHSGFPTEYVCIYFLETCNGRVYDTILEVALMLKQQSSRICRNICCCVHSW